ncbi:carbohydrate kinase family protein [Kitasatospora sp. NPDC088351]|uniref:carbohydrate kinase family protein n=1 Tax=unclassified Kitasatospora TaxID=2633591 RepID=UPI0034166668
MRIAVTGSIATDHLMTFAGRFADQLLPDQLAHVSLSFLADDLKVHHGGAAANIAFGLGRLGLAPLLVGAAGTDFADYRARLDAHGVDTGAVHVSETLHTARFVCTTDADQNQIATFYPGAMSEARRIDLAPLAARPGGLDLVLVAPDDPAAMLRHTDACRALDIPFAADPSQQLARLTGPEARRLVLGATLLFTNEYEAALLQHRTGLARAEILAQVGTWVTTLGPGGVTLSQDGRPDLTVPAVETTAVVDPTGAGDAFRSGFLTGLSWQWSREASARLGCALATTVLESAGSQEYKLSAADLAARTERAYGPRAADALRRRLEDVL